MQKEFVIIINALIWGIVLVACALVLKNTEAFRDIQLILGGGAAVSLLFTAVVGMRKRV